jgi:hypothetical protein
MLGLSSSDDHDRIDSGTGTVHEHTIEIGDNVIAIHSIGSMRIIDGGKNTGPTILGAGIALFGLAIFFSVKAIGLLLLFLGLALAAWNVLRKVDVYLSIGTCDGRSTFIVSKERKFLLDIRTFLRVKIDTKSEARAVFNISGNTFQGSTAIGSNPVSA